MTDYDEFEWFSENKYSKCYFGECVEVMDNKFKSESFDLIIADPPFGIGDQESLYNRDSDFVVGGYKEIENDYYKFSYDWMNEAYRVLKRSGSMFVISGWTNLEHVMRAATSNLFHQINHIILTKSFNAPTKNKFVSSHYHLIFYVKNKNKWYFNKPEGRNMEERKRIYHDMHDVWKMKTEYHPHKEKNVNKLPVDTITKILKYACPRNARALDPFFGNGTTGEACVRFGVQCVGIEINKNMKPIIKRNIESEIARLS